MGRFFPIVEERVDSWYLAKLTSLCGFSVLVFGGALAMNGHLLGWRQVTAGGRCVGPVQGSMGVGGGGVDERQVRELPLEETDSP